MGRRRFSGRKETIVRQSRRVAASDKARFHAEDGAGKSKVIRNFFSLNLQDVDDITDILERRLRARLRSS